MRFAALNYQIDSAQSHHFNFQLLLSHLINVSPPAHGHCNLHGSSMLYKVAVVSAILLSTCALNTYGFSFNTKTSRRVFARSYTTSEETDAQTDKTQPDMVTENRIDIRTIGAPNTGSVLSDPLSFNWREPQDWITVALATIIAYNTFDIAMFYVQKLSGITASN